MVLPWMTKGNVNTCMNTLDSNSQEIPYLRWVGSMFSTLQALTDLQVREISVGLAYLHSERIVHGDLRGVRISLIMSSVSFASNTERGKANILIDHNLMVHIADFGLAIVADSTFTTSHQEGNARWLCPSLLKGGIRRPDEACDVYSYGCVCVEVSVLNLVWYSRPLIALLSDFLSETTIPPTS